MARDSSGSKNEPQYSANGQPADAADLTEIAKYAADNGNRKALTSAQRAALSGADRWVGLEVYETDTGLVYEYTTAGWRNVGRSTTTRTRTTAQNIDNNGGTLDFNQATATPPVSDFSYNAGEFTCLIPGTFLVTGQFSLAGAGAQVGYSARVQKNAANVQEAANVTSTVGTNSVALLAAMPLVAGDVVRVLYFANINPAGVGMDVGAGKTYISLTRVG